MQSAGETFERAILVTTDGGYDYDAHSDAVHHINQVKLSPEAWQMCLDRFCNTEHPQVRLVSLSLLVELCQNRYEELQGHERASLRDTLMSWVRDYLPAHDQEPTYVRNTFAKFVVEVLKHEYPETWPTLFENLINCLTLSPNIVDLFFRILKCIDETIASNDLIPRGPTEAATCTLVKNAMRTSHVPQLVEVWLSLLATFGPGKQLPDLVNACLEIVGLYSLWIDIGLVANERFIPLIYSFLDNPELRDQAALCVARIVSKGSNGKPLWKMQFVADLNVLATVEPLFEVQDAYFQFSLATLINNVALGLLESWEELLGEEAPETPEGQRMGESTIPYVLHFLDSPAKEISNVVLPSCTSFIAKLKLAGLREGTGISDEEISYLTSLLPIILRKIRYDDNINFDNDDPEDFLAQYRRDLITLFGNVARTTPSLVKQFVYESVEQALNSEGVAALELEAALQLLYQLGEALKDEGAKPEENVFGRMVAMVIERGVVSHPHIAVKQVYFDIMNRYGRFLQFNPQYLPGVLGSFLDNRGIRYNHPLVRKKAANLFCSFVKKLKAQLAESVDDILNNLRDLLVQDPMNQQVAREDQTNIFEAVGILIGSLEERPDLQVQYLCYILDHFLPLMHEALNNSAMARQEPEGYVAMVAHHVVLVGTLSKGLDVRKNNALAAPFQRALEAVLSTLQTCPNSTEVRLKTLMFLHCMVRILEEALLEVMPTVSEFFIANANIPELTQFTSVLNQLVMRLKDGAAGLINQFYGSFLERVINLVSEAEQRGVIFTPRTEAERERDELRTATLALMVSILTQGIGQVMVSAENAGSLPQVLAGLLAISHTRDHLGPRLCFQVMGRALDQFGGLPGFSQFADASLLPTCFMLPLAPTFNLNDMQNVTTLGDVSALVRQLCVVYGDEASARIAQNILPSIGLNGDQVQEWMANLQNLEPKAFKQYFLEFFRAARASR